MSQYNTGNNYGGAFAYGSNFADNPPPYDNFAIHHQEQGAKPYPLQQYTSEQVPSAPLQEDQTLPPAYWQAAGQQ